MKPMTIILTVTDDGINCSASVDMTTAEKPNYLLLALGAMETAKMSMLAGRWGVFDSSEAKTDGLIYPPFYRQLTEERVRQMVLDAMPKRKRKQK